MGLISLGCSCTPDCPPLGASQGPPGPSGQGGPPGVQGPPGINNFSILTQVFIVPDLGSNSNAVMEDAEWMGIGESVFISGAGYFTVVQFNSTQVAILNNPGYVANANPGTAVGVGAQVSGAGPQGAAGQNFMLSSPIPVNLGGTGQSTAVAGFDALSPLSQPGQLLGFNGIDNAASLVPISNGQLVLSDSTTSIGFRWGNQSELVIPFNSIAPAGVLGSIIANNGTGYVSLPAGSNGYVLSANAAATAGLQWIPAVFNSFRRTLVLVSPRVLNGTEEVVGVNQSTPGPTAIILGPIAAYVGQFTLIKDERGDANVNSITLTTSDGSLIEGNPSFAITQSFGHVWVYSDGVQFQIF